MTKFVACKCPNCGANIKFDEKVERGTCKYCGADIIVERDIDTEIKKEVLSSIKNTKKMNKVFFVIFFIVFAVVVTIGILTATGVIFNNNGVSVNEFNIKLSLSGGSRNIEFVKDDLDIIVDSNSKYKDHQIYVVYDDINTNKADEIIKVRNSLKNTDKYSFMDYYVLLEYDKDGYINKYIITNALND